MEISVVVEFETVLEAASRHLPCDIFHRLKLALNLGIVFWKIRKTGQDV